MHGKLTPADVHHEREKMSEKLSALERYPEYRVDIGIEVHVQLNTKSKIFCGCSNEQTEQQNSHICPICCGYPGVLPVLSKEVITSAIKAALATNSTITPVSTFARKHYFYPDLPKSYQITQDKEPFCTDGHVMIDMPDGTQKKIRLIRIHIEEDAGKNLHCAGSGESFVDFNRAGTPLLEVVSHPDIESSEEAKEYLRTLRAIVQYLGITTGNMEEGSFRADTNISVRKKNNPTLGTRCELKNINSFKFIGDAVEYEIERQIELLEEGKKVIQQTRLWDTKSHVSKPMRSKEEAADYRYFQDPDLPLIEVSQESIERIREVLPELPAQKKQRLQVCHGLSGYEADILIEDRDLCSYYEQASKTCSSKQLINWLLRDVMGYVKEYKQDLFSLSITPEKLAELVNLIEQGIINTRAGQEVFLEVAQTGKNPTDVVKEKGLEQIEDTAALEAVIKEIIDSNTDNVTAYKSGKTKLFGFFVGEAMKRTKGKGNPKVINDLLQKYLN